MRAQRNRFTSKCSYCTKDMEPESGVILPNAQGGADAAYHFTCLDVMLSLRDVEPMMLRPDGVWYAKGQGPTEAPRPYRGVVPPRRKS